MAVINKQNLRVGRYIFDEQRHTYIDFKGMEPDLPCENYDRLARDKFDKSLMRLCEVVERQFSN